MHHVVFYEPPYHESRYNIWALRGGHKYQSILGNLHARAKLMILMSQVPPVDDPHRKCLESDYGVAFAQLSSPELMHPRHAGKTTAQLVSALRPLKPTVLSNLNGRGIGFCYASALAADTLDIDYVWRLGGNDLEARGEKAEKMLNPFWGTKQYFDRLVQERIAAHIAKRLIVMSQRERRRLVGMTADAGKINVCVRGVEQAHFRPLSARRAKQCRRFLFIGRRSVEKGYDILEDAMEILAGTHPDLTASFAGTYEIAEAGNRRYLGFVDYDDLPALYDGHDALIVCSRSEGFPQVVMEGMSCGLPCILTRNLFELEFSDNEDCLLIEPTPDCLARAMIRLASDGVFYRRLATRSLEIAQTRFSDAGNRARYHELLLAS